MLQKATEAARKAKEKGNLPIATIIAIGERVVSVGENAVMAPHFHPGRHAEIRALNELDDVDITTLHNATLYSTLEPCVMCLGSIILHRVGRVVFGAHDPDRGAGYLLPEISKRYPLPYLPLWIGPVSPEQFDPLFAEARALYRTIRPEPLP